MRDSFGLTLLETVIAIAICGIVLAALSTVATGSLRETRSGNHKTQATQVLDTVGRRIAGGNDLSLLPSVSEPLSLDGAAVDAMMGLNQFREGAFRVVVSNEGQFRVGNTVLYRYRIEACYDTGGNEQCVVGRTLGRQGGI